MRKTLWVYSAVAVVVLPLAALARGGDRFSFEVEATSPIDDAAIERPIHVASPAITLTEEKGYLIARHAANPKKEILRYPLRPRGDGEWMPWSQLHGNLIVFAWREFPNGPHRAGRDVVKAITLDRGRVMWTKEFEGFADWALRTSENRILVHDGRALVMLDAQKGDALWRTPHARPGVDVRFDEDLLLSTGAGVSRLALTSGKVRWILPAAFPQGLTVAGGVGYVVEFVDDATADAKQRKKKPSRPTVARLVRFDPATGGVATREELHHYQPLHDVRRAKIVPEEERLKIDVAYIVLD